MFTARVRSFINDADIIEYRDVRLCPAGIVASVTGGEMLFPWHRVEDVTSITKGAILMELEWSHS